jgi:lipid-binding SYLF domain-containing protein
MKHIRLIAIPLIVAFAAALLIGPSTAGAASKQEINRDVMAALSKMYEKSPKAKELSETAKGILVFPGITKGGFLVGGHYGEGALLINGTPITYYNTVALSYGLQAGVQKYGYALFFMTESAMNWIDKSDGWELGVGPSIVVVDAGAATSASTTTMQSEIYAIFFDQKGLMGGLGIQGTKITKINKY